MKLCKDCCFHNDVPFKLESAVCNHPSTEVKRISVITGNKITTYRAGERIDGTNLRPTCEFVRSIHGICGPDAVLFEEEKND